MTAVLNLCCWSVTWATTETKSNPKVLILGDSLSAAYNISIDQSWTQLFHQKILSKAPNMELVNASISGETTNGGVQRLPDLLQLHQPSHLIVELGGNDGLRGYKFEQTRSNLQRIIDMALQRNIKVLLIGVRLPPNLGPVYNQRFEQIYKDLSETMEVAFLPRFLEGVAAHKAEYMQADGIHPTALAQPILADKVFQVFSSEFLSP